MRRSKAFFDSAACAATAQLERSVVGAQVLSGACGAAAVLGLKERFVRLVFAFLCAQRTTERAIPSNGFSSA